MQLFHQMFNVSALLLNDALKPATPLTNDAINETLRHTLDISHQEEQVVQHLYIKVYSGDV